MVHKVVHIVLLACYLDIIISAPQELPSLENSLSAIQNFSSDNNIVAKDGSEVVNVGQIIVNNFTTQNQDGLLTGLMMFIIILVYLLDILYSKPQESNIVNQSVTTIVTTTSNGTVVTEVINGSATNASLPPNFQENPAYNNIFKSFFSRQYS